MVLGTEKVNQEDNNYELLNFHKKQVVSAERSNRKAETLHLSFFKNVFSMIFYFSMFFTSLI